VAFILEQYGEEKMAELLQVFRKGAYYDDGLQQVLGLDSGGLDAAWRAWLGAGPVSTPEPAKHPPPISTPLPEWVPTAGWLAAGGCCLLVPLIVVGALGLLLIWRAR